MNFNDIKEKNNLKIENLKLELQNNPDNETLKKRMVLQNKIAELLSNDEALFFNITVDEAFQILNQILDDSSKIKSAYIDLTSPEEYERLRYEFKI